MNGVWYWDDRTVASIDWWQNGDTGQSANSLTQPLCAFLHVDPNVSAELSHADCLVSYPAYALCGREVTGGKHFHRYQIRHLLAACFVIHASHYM